MFAHDDNDALVTRCDACGRVVPVGSSWKVATLNLCSECAAAWQTRSRAGWPPPGYVWDGSRWRFDAESLGQQSAASYQPTERELRWWRFLGWLVAHGKLSTGPDEGADRYPDLVGHSPIARRR
ncbi:MAG: hypothetical protein IRY97_03715 [Thermomicrobiaceae bacterium]|nr:hypothetical protein [Thermomicrobiaceae bacterium]